MTNKKKNSVKGAAGAKTESKGAKCENKGAKCESKGAKTESKGNNAMHAAGTTDVSEAMGSQIAGMMHDGEVLGNEMVVLLAQYGSSVTGLTIGVYALAKAWGSLRAMCHYKGIRPGKLFDGLVPSFEQEAEQILQEFDELPAAAGKSREGRMKK